MVYLCSQVHFVVDAKLLEVRCDGA